MNPGQRIPGLALLARWALTALLGTAGSIGACSAARSAEIACICSLNEIPGDPGTDRLLRVPPSGGDGVLVEASLPSSNKRQIFRLQTRNGQIAWSAVSDIDTGPVQTTFDFGDAGFAIAADKGLFSVRARDSEVTLKPFGAEQTGEVHSSSQIPGMGLLVASDNGLFLVTKIKEHLDIRALPVQLSGLSGAARIRLEELPGLGWLVDYQTGEYFLAQVNGDNVVLAKATVRSNGFGGVWGQVHEVKGLGVLINDPTAGMSLVRMKNGTAVIDSIGDQVVAQVRDTRWVPEIGLFIDTGNTTFLARLGESNISVDLAARTQTGIPRIVFDLPGSRGKLLATSTGLFLATSANDQSRIEAVSDDSTITGIESMSDSEVVLATDKGLKSTRMSGLQVSDPEIIENPKRPAEFSRITSAVTTSTIDTDKGHYVFNAFGPNKGLQLAYGSYTAPKPESAEPTKGPAPIGRRTLTWLHALGNERWLGIGNDTVLLLRRIETESHGPESPETHSRLYLIGDQSIGRPNSVMELAGVGWLIAATNGLFLVRVDENDVGLEQLSKSATQLVGDVQEVERQRWLVASDTGLYYLHPGGAGSNDVGWTLDTVGGRATGRIKDIHPIKDLGWLVGTENGLYLVHNNNGALTTDLMGKGSGGKIDHLQEMGSAGWLMTVDQRVLVAIRASFLAATVTPLGGYLYGNPPDTDLDSPIDFSVEHLCAGMLQQAGLTAELTSPTGHTTPLDVGRIGNFGLQAGKTTFTARLPIHTPGAWTLQFVVQRSAVRQLIGRPMKITFSSDQTFRERVAKLSAWGGFIAAALNVFLFVSARRSPMAWRVATDDSLGTAILRIATLALSHLAWAQLWILDLYFIAVRRQERPPFLPMPLIRTDGVSLASEEILAASWRRRRIWVQGNSGMGKSALYRHLTEEHFHGSATSYEAYRKWGCVFVAFSARDFATGGDDEIKPDWVIDAVRATLSQKELTFEDDKLLRRMLHSGVIGVVIDGVHEVGRAKAVEAFASTYAAAPMLVTSQEPGSQQFENYRLPPDMRGFTNELLRVYLSEMDADVVMKRIVTSGLNDSISSGYDVRLIIDIVRNDTHGTRLPSSRIGLYDEVVKTGWPLGPRERIQQQLDRTAAAAWQVVSERKPNEDKRRFIPGADLDADLLNALADAPERDGKPVRLMRRVGKVFEFVHDQMHAYLAARWFTQPGFTSQELERMTAASSIWADSAPARRTLWSFVAALLDNERLLALWKRVEERAEWDILRRELKSEAKKRGLSAPD